MLNNEEEEEEKEEEEEERSRTSSTSSNSSSSNNSDDEDVNNNNNNNNNNSSDHNNNNNSNNNNNNNSNSCNNDELIIPYYMKKTIGHKKIDMQDRITTFNLSTAVKVGLNVLVNTPFFNNTNSVEGVSDYVQVAFVDETTQKIIAVFEVGDLFEAPIDGIFMCASFNSEENTIVFYFSDPIGSITKSPTGESTTKIKSITKYDFLIKTSELKNIASNTLLESDLYYKLQVNNIRRVKKFRYDKFVLRGFYIYCCLILLIIFII